MKHFHELLVLLTKKDFWLVLLTVGIPIVLNLAYLKYISYQIDIKVYGNYILMQAFVSVCTTIFTQLLSESYARFFYETSSPLEYRNEFIIYLIALNIIVLLPFGIYGVIYADKFSHTEIILLYIYFFVFGFVAINQQSLFMRIERERSLFIKILELVGRLFIPCIFYYFSKTLLSLITGLVFGYLITAFVILYMEFRTLGTFKMDLVRIKEYWKYSFPAVIISIPAWSISNSNKFFIDSYLGEMEVGQFALLSQLSGLGQLIGQAYGLYLNPIILKATSRSHRHALAITNFYFQKLVIFCLLIFGIFLLIPLNYYSILVNQDILKNSYHVLVMLVIAGILAVLQNAFSMNFVIHKRLDLVVYSFTVAFFVNIVGNLFIKEHGIYAAALSLVASYAVIILLQFIYLNSLDDSSSKGKTLD